MAMLNNWDIGGGLSDFWNYIREPRPHRWACWGLAVVLPALIFYGFSENLFPYQTPKPQIIYFENWTVERSAAEIRADWVARAKETTRENAKRRAEFQRIADGLGIEYDATEADRVTRETLGEEAAALAEKPAPPPQRSNIAERAARRPQGTAPAGR